MGFSGAAEISVICSRHMHIFYFIFVQFMQFPVLDIGLDHYASEPFKYLLRKAKFYPVLLYLYFCPAIATPTARVMKCPGEACWRPVSVLPCSRALAKAVGRGSRQRTARPDPEVAAPRARGPARTHRIPIRITVAIPEALVPVKGLHVVVAVNTASLLNRSPGMTMSL